VTVPPDLKKAFQRDATAKKAFEGMSYSHKRQYVLAIEGAKAPETRQRRIDKTIEKLREAAAGKKA
jgi:uncharacterized protein YdeI (YjbR/CyaY-like superfamily)